MTALTVKFDTLPTVTEGRCVLVTPEPPPCPECDRVGGWDEPDNPHDDRFRRWITCQTCNGSGLAPDGTTIIGWTGAGWTCNFADSEVLGAEATADYCYKHQDFCHEGDAWFAHAAVRLVGTLDECVRIYHTDDDGTLGWFVRLRDVRVLDTPITEWSVMGVGMEGEWRTIDRHDCSFLPDGWSRCPEGLREAVEG